MLIHSGRENKLHYVVLPAETLDDQRLSANAVRLLGYMLNQSMKWQFYVAQLARHYGVSRQTISTWMSELIKYRYIVREKHRANENALKWVYTYEVYPLPKERYWTVYHQWEAWKKRNGAPQPKDNITDISQGGA